MGKKAKHRRGRGTVVQPKEKPELLIRKAESALARGEIDAACEMLSAARQSGGVSPDKDTCARAYTLKAYTRWDKPARALAALDQAVEVAPDRADLRRLRANLLRRLGRLKLALSELTEARRLAPKDPQLAFETLLARLAAGERGQQLAAFALELDGPIAQRASALLAVVAGDLAAAERLLAASADPVDRLMLAVLLLSQHRPARVVPWLETATAENLPESIRAYGHFYLGVAHMQRRELRPAVNALERARELGAPQDDVRAHLAWVYQQLAIDAVLDSDLTAAAEWFGRLEKLGGPEAVGARENAAYALALHGQEAAQAGDHDAAVRAWSQALALTPGDLALRQNLAIALERAGMVEEAIPHWQELVRKMPKAVAGSSRRSSSGQSQAEEEVFKNHIRAVAHRHLADLYLEQDDVERAIDQLERALQAAPSEVDTRRLLARILMEEGRVRKAISHLEQVVAAEPDSAEDHLELGMAYLGCEAEEAGLEHLERAYALEPDNPAAQWSLGVALATRALQNPDAASALEGAQRAVALLPPSLAPIGSGALGAARLARGDRRGAEKSFKEAIKQSSDKANTILNIGNIYWRAGDHQQAVKAWIEAMKKGNKSPEVYPLLIESWAKAGEAKWCRQAIEEALWHGYLDEAVDAVKKEAKSPETKAFLRQVLYEVVDASDDVLDRAHLAEMLLYVGDVQAARSLAGSVARAAVQEEDYEAMTAVIDLDMRYRILDRKAAGVILDWIDRNPTSIREPW